MRQVFTIYFPNRITKLKQSATKMVALFLCRARPTKACFQAGWCGAKKPASAEQNADLLQFR